VRLFHFGPVTASEETNNGVAVVTQRLKVQEMVMHIYEKNLVLTNILRDIVENETGDIFSSTSTEEEFCRALNDKAARRLELVAEIEDFLRREASAHRVGA
jgi:hypothetical protein